MTKQPRENRVPIMMSEDELKAVDDWRFGNRIATRSDAIRRLCQIGLGLSSQKEQLLQLKEDILTASQGIGKELQLWQDSDIEYLEDTGYFDKLGELVDAALSLAKEVMALSAFVSISSDSDYSTDDSVERVARLKSMLVELLEKKKDKIRSSK